MSKPAPTSPHVRIRTRTRTRTQIKASASSPSSGSDEPVPGDVNGEPLDRSQSTKATPYAVGYKRPPRHTQFRKGQSGNPRGRPKGAPNVETIVTKLMNTRRSVRIDGQDRTMSSAEIIFHQQLKKAMTGDLKATQLFVSFLREIETKAHLAAAASAASDTSASSDEGIDETEAAILLHHYRAELTDRGLDEGAIEIALMALGLVPDGTDR